MSQRNIYFVGWMKSNAQFEVVEELEPMGKEVLKGQIIRVSLVKGEAWEPSGFAQAYTARTTNTRDSRCISVCGVIHKATLVYLVALENFSMPVVTGE